jgi:hypothetical protein
VPETSASHRAENDVQVIESCNSTWLFDAPRMRFRRVPKGTSIDVPVPPEDWQRYYSLELHDDNSGAFVVALNEAETRLLRSYRHSVPCPHCDAHATTELSLEAVKLGHSPDDLVS